MGQFYQSPAVQIVFAVAALVVVLAVLAYVVGRLREVYLEKGATANELLTDFRELHSQGELSDDEFRTIKGMLAERAQREWKENAQGGPETR